MHNAIESLHNYLEALNEQYGGDVGFIPVITNEKIDFFEKNINWKLPAVFTYFLLSESNGIAIVNKRIYGLFDDQHKKALLIIWKETMILERVSGSKVDRKYLMIIS
jgi:hypothetical protein